MQENLYLEGSVNVKRDAIMKNDGDNGKDGKHISFNSHDSHVAPSSAYNPIYPPARRPYSGPNDSVGALQKAKQ